MSGAYQRLLLRPDGTWRELADEEAVLGTIRFEDLPIPAPRLHVLETAEGLLITVPAPNPGEIAPS